MVSICIPAYKQTKFLKRLLDSIAEQTYTNFEVVVTDDTPGNEVKDLVELYTGKYVINYFKNTTALGSPANWNRSIELAKGDVIKIMHHDDWFNLPDSLGKFVLAIEKEDADFVFCASEILDVKENTVRYNSPDANFVEEIKKTPDALFNNNLIGAPSAVIFKRKINELFDVNLKYLVDVDFYMRLLKKSSKIEFIKEPLIVNTSNNDEQVTASSINKEVQVGEYCYLYNKHFHGIKPTERYKEFFLELFNWYGLKKFTEITSLGYPHPKPTLYFKWLLFKLNWRK